MSFNKDRDRDGRWCQKCGFSPPQIRCQSLTFWFLPHVCGVFPDESKVSRPSNLGQQLRTSPAWYRWHRNSLEVKAAVRDSGLNRCSLSSLFLLFLPLHISFSRTSFLSPSPPLHFHLFSGLLLFSVCRPQNRKHCPAHIRTRKSVCTTGNTQAHTHV